jgi:hypothetical protein
MSMNMSTMSATAVSDWPTPTVSTTTTSKPAASDCRDRLAGPAGDAAEGGARGRGRMKSALLGRKPGHARLVAEDGAAADLRGGIDRQHGDPMTLPDHMQAEGLG